MAGTGPNPEIFDGKAGWVAEGKMINLRLPLIIFLVCAGLLLGAVKVNASQSVVFSLGDSSISSLEILEDLDARDVNNQPIASKKAKDGLTEIFRTGLFNLLTTSELYSAAQVLAAISKTLNLGSQNISRKLPAAVKSLMAAILPTVKQLQKILVCIAALFGFGLIISKFTIFNLQFSMSLGCSSPIVLRC